jgi:hypothetical protein
MAHDISCYIHAVEQAEELLRRARADLEKAKKPDLSINQAWKHKNGGVYVSLPPLETGMYQLLCVSQGGSGDSVGHLWNKDIGGFGSCGKDGFEYLGPIETVLKSDKA